MAQHFLLSADARTLNLKDIYRMSDEAAFQAFARIRFLENGGEPFCPVCGGVDALGNHLIGDWPLSGPQSVQHSPL